MAAAGRAAGTTQPQPPPLGPPRRSSSATPRSSGTARPDPARSGALGPTGSRVLGPTQSGALSPTRSGTLGPSESRALGSTGSGALGPTGSRALGPSRSSTLSPTRSGTLGPSESRALGPTGSGGLGPTGSRALGRAGRHVPASSPLFSLRELVQLLGFSTFEIFIHLLALLMFSVLLALRVDELAPGLSWWNVFMPFFVADGLSAYFSTIVSLRLFHAGKKRVAVLRLFWTLTILGLKFVSEMLLCQKLVEQTRELWFGLIMSPVFILLHLLMFRACGVR